jgi:hypothetical protein
MRYDYEVGKIRRADLEIPTTLDGKILRIWFARTLRARMHGTLRTKGSGTPKLKYSMPRKMFDVLFMGCRRKREPKRIVISLDLKEFEEFVGLSIEGEDRTFSWNNRRFEEGGCNTLSNKITVTYYIKSESLIISYHYKYYGNERRRLRERL